MGRKRKENPGAEWAAQLERVDLEHRLQDALERAAFWEDRFRAVTKALGFGGHPRVRPETVIARAAELWVKSRKERPC